VLYKLRDAQYDQKLSFARVDREGSLKVTRTRGRLYVEEINLGEARKIKSRAKEYQKTLDYIDQND
jgi:hypothetical protein